MEQMVLSKNIKQKTETDHSQEQTWGSQKGKGRELDRWALGRFFDANCYIWNGWAM